jgi:spore germination protein (amino acid permease)
MQLGVGILDLKGISRPAEHDAWISIIISGISIHVIIWLLYRILNKGKGDIIAIHKELFGKWVGGFLSILIILYFICLAIVVLRLYIEIIQLWIFPQLSTWIFGFVLLMVVGYFVINGFRVVTGICFLSTLYMIPILLTFLFPLKFAHYSNLFPIMDHSFIDILGSAKNVTQSMSGIELLLIFYPFIKHPDKSEKWAHFAVVFTTIIYVFVAFVTFVYYNQDQLQSIVWPTIMFWKIVEFPAIERFEHFGIAAWFFVVLPNICLALWGAHRGLMQLFSVNKKALIIGIMFITLLVTGLFEKRSNIEQLSKFSNEVSFYLLYCYIPFLFLVQNIIYKIRGNKQKN